MIDTSPVKRHAWVLFLSLCPDRAVGQVEDGWRGNAKINAEQVQCKTNAGIRLLDRRRPSTPAKTNSMQAPPFRRRLIQVLGFIMKAANAIRSRIVTCFPPAANVIRAEPDAHGGSTKPSSRCNRKQPRPHNIDVRSSSVRPSASKERWSVSLRLLLAYAFA
jgi:hypothetical protein